MAQNGFEIWFQGGFSTHYIKHFNEGFLAFNMS